MEGYDSFIRSYWSEILWFRKKVDQDGALLCRSAAVPVLLPQDAALEALWLRMPSHLFRYPTLGILRAFFERKLQCNL